MQLSALLWPSCTSNSAFFCDIHANLAFQRFEYAPQSRCCRSLNQRQGSSPSLAMKKLQEYMVPAVNTATSGNHIVNFTPTLIGRHDAMFDIASLCFDGVSGLRLAVAGLEDVQVWCSVPCAHVLRRQLIRTVLCSDISCSFGRS